MNGVLSMRTRCFLEPFSSIEISSKENSNLCSAASIPNICVSIHQNVRRKLHLTAAHLLVLPQFKFDPSVKQKEKQSDCWFMRRSNVLCVRSHFRLSRIPSYLERSLRESLVFVCFSLFLLLPIRPVCSECPRLAWITWFGIFTIFFLLVDRPLNRCYETGGRRPAIGRAATVRPGC